MFDKILAFRHRPGAAACVAVLPPVAAHREPFDEAVAGNGDHHVFFGNHVFHREFFVVLHNLGAAVVAVSLFQLQHLVFYDLHLQVNIGQNRLQPFDGLENVSVFILDLFALQAGEALQPHVQDGLRLDFGKPETAHQVLAGGIHVGRFLDNSDDLIDVVQRNF